jgi:hypothetical protein
MPDFPRPVLKKRNLLAAVNAHSGKQTHHVAAPRRRYRFGAETYCRLLPNPSKQEFSIRYDREQKMYRLEKKIIGPYLGYQL